MHADSSQRPPCTSATAGYASDDEQPARRLSNDFGALPGDKPRARKMSGQDVVDYGIRQASARPSGKKVRFLDVLVGPNKRWSAAQTKPRNGFERHSILLSWLPGRSLATAPEFKSDVRILRESHRFLRSDADDDGSWEAQLARRYYDRLFKEYVICDLSGYKKGHVGFRWRTQAEVLQGKGQFFCGHKRCESQTELRSYEVDFKYNEAGKGKRALVKVRLCEACAYKLHYRRLRKARKRLQRHPPEKESHRSKRGPMNSDMVFEEIESSSAESQSDGATEGAADEHAAPEVPSAADKRRLEALAWRGPDPEARTREDEFDDYFSSLLM